MRKSSGSTRESLLLPVYDRGGSEHASIVVAKEVAKFQTKIGAPKDLGGSGGGGS